MIVRGTMEFGVLADCGEFYRTISKRKADEKRRLNMGPKLVANLLAEVWGAIALSLCEQDVVHRAKRVHNSKRRVSEQNQESIICTPKP